MKDSTRDQSLAVDCARKLRERGIFAEVMSSGPSYDARYAVYVESLGDGGAYADLVSALRGEAVKFRKEDAVRPT